jgi:hypothetical protein
MKIRRESSNLLKVWSFTQISVRLIVAGDIATKALSASGMVSGCYGNRRDTNITRTRYSVTLYVHAYLVLKRLPVA